MVTLFHRSRRAEEMDLPIVEIIPILFFEVPLNFLSVEFSSPFLGIKGVKVDVVGKPSL